MPEAEHGRYSRAHRGAVTAPKLAHDAVTGGNVRDGALTSRDFAAEQLLNWRAAWTPTTTYHRKDAVRHDGASYVAEATNTGSAPPSRNWSLLAARGVPGLKGDTGPAGPSTGALTLHVNDGPIAGCAVPIARLTVTRPSRLSSSPRPPATGGPTPPAPNFEPALH